MLKSDSVIPAKAGNQDLIAWIPGQDLDNISKYESDLALAFASWNDISIKNPTKLVGKNILIVASANIPITWLYPARVAALMGAESVTIKLPSSRSDNQFACNTRKKIQNLIVKVRPDLLPTKLYTLTSDDELDANHFDSVIVFGTDETVAAFKSKFINKKINFIPQGNVINSLVVDLENDSNPSPSDIAELCSLWNGRGCLTPVCLFLNCSDRGYKKKWISEFHFYLDKNFIQRFEEEKLSEKYLHSHYLIYINSVIKSLNVSSGDAILSGKIAHVINLTEVPSDNFPKNKIDISYGGTGFVFILDISLKQLFPKITSAKITPALSDKHGSVTWQEYL